MSGVGSGMAELTDDSGWYLGESVPHSRELTPELKPFGSNAAIQNNRHISTFDLNARLNHNQSANDGLNGGVIANTKLMVDPAILLGYNARHTPTRKSQDKKQKSLAKVEEELSKPMTTVSPAFSELSFSLAFEHPSNGAASKHNSMASELSEAMEVAFAGHQNLKI